MRSEKFFIFRFIFSGIFDQQFVESAERNENSFSIKNSVLGNIVFPFVFGGKVIATTTEEWIERERKRRLFTDKKKGSSTKNSIHFGYFAVRNMFVCFSFERENWNSNETQTVLRPQIFISHIFPVWKLFFSISFEFSLILRRSLASPINGVYKCTKCVNIFSIFQNEKSARHKSVIN